MEIPIPKGKKAEWVNGVLTLVDEKPIEYKFKVGDKVKVVHHNDGLAYEVVEQCLCDGEPAYYIKHNDLVELCYERFLKPFSEDITERIKTFDDAVEWCSENGHGGVLLEYNVCAFQLGNLSTSADILAYLQLRIIACALNEGWEPTFEGGEESWGVSYVIEDKRLEACLYYCLIETSTRLMFKSAELAQYAASQFADIYAEFLGIKKGGEE